MAELPFATSVGPDKVAHNEPYQPPHLDQHFLPLGSDITQTKKFRNFADINFVVCLFLVLYE